MDSRKLIRIQNLDNRFGLRKAILTMLLLILYPVAFCQSLYLFDLHTTDTNVSDKPARTMSSSYTYTSSVNGGSNHTIVDSVKNSNNVDILGNLERSVAAVLIKVAYGTTSTTKRSIPDNFLPSLTTVATPPLTTIRYLEKSPREITLNQRSYEVDLEKDHALPTSAPNADILKSNSNPTYPNPNRHSTNDREKYRFGMNSTPLPLFPSLPSNTPFNKNTGTLPMTPVFAGDMPSYSPPSRSFFTPPLPPEYQNPFADKPTLRGTNNEGIISNSGGTYINRRPLPPPSLMPGHERIPFRPPDNFNPSIPLLNSSNIIHLNGSSNDPLTFSNKSSVKGTWELEHKKALNTPSRGVAHTINQHKNNFSSLNEVNNHVNTVDSSFIENPTATTRNEVLPYIKRILNGSNGNKGEIPEVLLKQATSRPLIKHHQPPSSPVVLLDLNIPNGDKDEYSKASLASGAIGVSNINQSKIKNPPGNSTEDENHHSVSSANEKDINLSNSEDSYRYDKGQGSSQANRTSLIIMKSLDDQVSATTFSSTRRTYGAGVTLPSINQSLANNNYSTPSSTDSTSNTISWSIAWNIHIYSSVILFTILGVYSFYKILTFDKLTYLFSQSYFVCIHLLLIAICLTRIFYLCYDAYNIHSTFHIFVSELLLNLPATFLTICFSVLILFLFLKALDHKSNRYSALVRPLTVFIGCGVHVFLCVTLHYVESYTIQNQQLQQKYIRRQNFESKHQIASGSQTSLSPASPPRVLSIICQIIYIFICLSLGILYLYAYRLLRRILRSKSQNYIHGYQKLSYAIHITIATALLFVLLAFLQIFGAIGISLTQPLFSSHSSVIGADMDWLLWGYQFSLRLIEIAIVTLISWVAGLKIGVALNGLHPVIPDADAINSAVHGNGNSTQKHRPCHMPHLRHDNPLHTNVTSFFLPCTSSSSQEQFEADYPTICTANTNLHTFTMRTGKLLYDDNIGLGDSTSFGPVISSSQTEFCSTQKKMYQQHYDGASLCTSSANAVPSSCGISHNFGAHVSDSNYLADPNTDHYENPNFELRTDRCEGNLENILTAQASTSTTASCSGSGSTSGTSNASQHQMLLMQEQANSDNSYSEPIQPFETTNNCNYDINTFGFSKYGVNDKPENRNWKNTQHPTTHSLKVNYGTEKDEHCEQIGRSSNSAMLYSGSLEAPCTAYGAEYGYKLSRAGEFNNFDTDKFLRGDFETKASNSHKKKRIPMNSVIPKNRNQVYHCLGGRQELQGIIDEENRDPKQCLRNLKNDQALIIDEENDHIAHKITQHYSDNELARKTNEKQKDMQLIDGNDILFPSGLSNKRNSKNCKRNKDTCQSTSSIYIPAYAENDEACVDNSFQIKTDHSNMSQGKDNHIFTMNNTKPHDRKSNRHLDPPEYFSETNPRKKIRCIKNTSDRSGIVHFHAQEGYDVNAKIT